MTPAPTVTPPFWRCPCASARAPQSHTVARSPNARSAPWRPMQFGLLRNCLIFMAKSRAYSLAREWMVPVGLDAGSGGVLPRETRSYKNITKVEEVGGLGSCLRLRFLVSRRPRSGSQPASIIAIGLRFGQWIDSAKNSSTGVLVRGVYCRCRLRRGRVQRTATKPQGHAGFGSWLHDHVMLPFGSHSRRLGAQLIKPLAHVRDAKPSACIGTQDARSFAVGALPEDGCFDGGAFAVQDHSAHRPSLRLRARECAGK